MTAKEILNDLGAIITDSHIVFSSGRHGSACVLNKDMIYLHPEKTRLLCVEMAIPFLSSDIDVVIGGPEAGGAILAQWTAHALTMASPSHEALAIYAEKENTAYTRERNYNIPVIRGWGKLVKGKKVLVVDDVLTTVGSVKGVVEAVRAWEGEVVGVAVLCMAGEFNPEDFGRVPKLVTLVKVNTGLWPEYQCLLCDQGVPINTQVGMGKDFLAKRAGGVNR